MKTKVQKLVWDESGNICTIDYQKIGKKISFDRRDFTAEVRDHAERHGLEQRFGDLESGDKVGEAKFQAATALKDQYLSSKEWSRQVERDTLSELIAAVHKVVPEVSMEDLAIAAEADPDQVQDWRDDSRVKVHLAAARLAKAQARAKADGEKPLTIKGLK